MPVDSPSELLTQAANNSARGRQRQTRDVNPVQTQLGRAGAESLRGSGTRRDAEGQLEKKVSAGGEICIRCEGGTFLELLDLFESG